MNEAYILRLKLVESLRELAELEPKYFGQLKDIHVEIGENKDE